KRSSMDHPGRKILLSAAFLLGLISLLNCEKKSDPGGESHQDQVDRLYGDYDQYFQTYLAGAVQAVGKPTIVLENLSDHFTVPKKIAITGTPYEIGFTVGHIASQFSRLLPRRSDANRELNEQIVEMYRRIYPQYLEIIRGISAAYQVEFDQVDLTDMEYQFFVELWWNLLNYDRFSQLTDFGRHGDVGPTQNCSVASYFTGERQIVGRNFDNSSDRPHYFATMEVNGCYRMMGHIVYSMYHWVVDGINEKGLSIDCATNGEEYFWQELYPQEPAVFAGHMARIVMDTCATVDEAVALIGSVRVWFPNEGLHWVIADAAGDSAVVEFDLGRKMVVIDKPGPYELMTNTALQKGEDYVTGNCWRYQRAKPMLEAGIAGTGEMLNIMSSVRPTSGGARTLWTSIMDVNSRTFEVYYRKEYSRKYVFGF
ncbi:MAG: C45 family autoproteolytic acyltransferase/hydrolase, partial [Candidatus Aminicenantes bacterium]|nr:C45 family autoproteolytic acyltransferase/hydrolase [Candidatus Aminicenantes bacterium]